MRSLGVLLALGCLVAPGAGAQVASVEVTPSTSSVTAGQTLQFRAVARDSAGAVIASGATLWLSGPFEVAAVDQAGLLRTFRQGSVKVLARIGGKVGSASITVNPKAPVRVDLNPDTKEVVVGGLSAVRGVAVTEDGEPRHEMTLRYTSSNPEIASVDDGGAVSGKRAGEVTITASAAAGVTGQTMIKVVPNPVRQVAVTGPATVRVGDVAHFAAAPADASGRAVAKTPVRWALTGTGASIDPDGGFVAERAGTYIVSGVVGSVSGSTTVRVTPRTPTRQLETVASVVFGDLQAAEGWAIGDVWYVSTVADRVYTFDISDPAKPTKVDSVMVDARIVNDITTTADGKIGVMSREGASSRKNGIVFLDLSSPLHPKVISEYTATVSAGVHSAFVDKHYVYLTDDGARALKVIDFQDPKNPREVGRWQIESSNVHSDEASGATVGRYLHDVQVKDGLAYLAYFKDGAVILDVGNGIKGGSPENPKFVSRYTYNTADYYPPDMLAGTHSVFRFKNYLVVGDEVFPQFFDTNSRDHIKTLGNLQILDVSDIEHPRKVAEYHVPEQGSHNVWVEDDVMYIGNFEAGIRVVDVSGELRGDLKAQGREIGAIRAASPKGFRPNVPMTWGAQPHKGYIFATDMASGIWVAKLSPKTLVP